MGDPNASIPTPQPVHYRPMFGAFGQASQSTCVHFVSGLSVARGNLPPRCQRPFVAVRNCRTVGKRDMIHNDAMPLLEVDPETYTVRADGVELRCEPAEVLPMAQRYFLF
jgi:urease subunit alpha